MGPSDRFTNAVQGGMSELWSTGFHGSFIVIAIKKKE
jgi:hypothetical protein